MASMKNGEENKLIIKINGVMKNGNVWRGISGVSENQSMRK